jgi:hypothetical protein
LSFFLNCPSNEGGVTIPLTYFFVVTLCLCLFLRIIKYPRTKTTYDSSGRQQSLYLLPLPQGDRDDVPLFHYASPLIGFDLKLNELSEGLRAEALQSQQASPDPTDDLETRRRLLEKLRLEIVANPQSYEFSFKLAGQIISTADADDEAFFNQALKEFEQQHPDISIEDLLAVNKQLPEDTPFAKIVNQVKQNLVTIERTSASLFRCRYSYIEGKGYSLSTT